VTTPGITAYLLFLWNADVSAWDLVDSVGGAVSYEFDRAYSHGGNNRLGMTADAPGSYDELYVQNIADPTYGTDQDARVTVTAQGYVSGASPHASTKAELFCRSSPSSSYAELRAGGKTLKIDANGVQAPVTPRIATVTSSATPTPDVDASDVYAVSALAVPATFGAPTGTPVDMQRLLIRINDNGTSRALSWNAAYRACASLALPTATEAGKTMYLGFLWNADDSKWDFLSVLDGF
jgi:hypothetical protein